jgi:hypothetical protein
VAQYCLSVHKKTKKCKAGISEVKKNKKLS